jgi:peptidoglycan/LPS O-acetylase OafA/YrhL
MQLVLSTRYTKAKLGKGWAFQFYKARYSRLLPTYLLACVLVVATALRNPILAPLPAWSYVWALPDTAGNFFFKAFFCFTNMTIFFQDGTLFLSAHDGLVYLTGNYSNSEMLLWKGLIIPQSWSLGIELSFYALAPYFLNLRSRWLVVGSIFGLGIKIIAIKGLHLHDPWTYRFFPFELGYFFLGALAFRYRSRIDRIIPERIERYCVYPLAIAIAAFRLPVPLATLTYPIALACVLPFLFRMTSGSNVDRLIGELSYPFYIFHLFALALVGNSWRGPQYSVAWIALGLTLILSVMSFGLETRFIEPWRAKLHKTRPVSQTVEVTQMA